MSGQCVKSDVQLMMFTEYLPIPPHIKEAMSKT